jgi:hypothetical protein
MPNYEISLCGTLQAFKTFQLMFPITTLLQIIYQSVIAFMNLFKDIPARNECFPTSE